LGLRDTLLRPGLSRPSRRVSSRAKSPFPARRVDCSRFWPTSVRSCACPRSAAPLPGRCRAWRSAMWTSSMSPRRTSPRQPRIDRWRGRLPASSVPRREAAAPGRWL